MKLKRSIVILIIGILLIVGIYAIRTVYSVGIASNGKIEATLLESPKCFVTRRRTTKEISGEKRTVTRIEVYQQMILEYELNGQTVKNDIGSVQIGVFDEVDSVSIADSDENYIKMFKYDVGDKIEIYLSADGKARLADDVDNQHKENIAMIIGFTIFLLFVIFDNKKSDKKKAKSKN